MAGRGGGGALSTQISGNWSLMNSSSSSCMPRQNKSFVRTTGFRRRTTSYPVVRAASPNPPTEDKAPFLSQEELKYVVQVGGVSIAGAALIKYGSILFPQITRPNISEALFIIFAPVLVAIFLLIKQSRV